MSTARLFYLTLPSGRTVPITAFTCGELADIVDQHFRYPLGSSIAMTVWRRDRIAAQINFENRWLTEVKT